MVQRQAKNLMLLWLKAGDTALRTVFQCSSVWPVNRLVPPKNCTAVRKLMTLCRDEILNGPQVAPKPSYNVE